MMLHEARECSGAAPMDKLRDKHGLTMVEMLCATLILILLGLLINSGLHMAMSSYHSMVLQSETKLLLASLSDVLADELRHADDIKTTGGKLSEYRSTRYGEGTKLEVSSTGTEQGQIYARTGTGADEKSYRMLPDGAYGRGTWVCGIPPADGLEITFDGTDLFTVKLKVQEMTGDRSSFVTSGIMAEAEFTVRCLNPEPSASPMPAP